MFLHNAPNLLTAKDTAKIELIPDQIQEFILNVNLSQLVTQFQGYGFMYVTLDLEGYRSGKLNQVLTAMTPE